jgi:hypothetical protein
MMITASELISLAAFLAVVGLLLLTGIAYLVKSNTAHVWGRTTAITLIATSAFATVAYFNYAPPQQELDRFLTETAIELYNREIEQNQVLQATGQKSLANEADLRAFEARFNGWHKISIQAGAPLERQGIFGRMMLYIMRLRGEQVHTLALGYEVGGNQFSAHVDRTPSGLESEYERGEMSN